MIIGIDAHSLEGNRTGVGRYLFNLLREWAANDECQRVNVRFVLYFKNEIPKDLPQLEMFESRLLKVGSTAKFIHWNLWQQVKKDKIDILFCPGYIAPIFWRGKLALTLHDIIYETHPEWFAWKSPADKILLKWASKTSAKKADVIITISEFSRREIAAHYDISQEKITLTPLAADPSLALSEFQTGQLNSVKQKFGIKDKFAFFIASIFERRHLPETIEAFKRLARADLQLLIGGRDYTVGKKVDRMVVATNRELGREAVLRVDFIKDDELKLLYASCAFFIWLSDYEGFGLPPLEAMSCGAPVITSDGTSLKEAAGQAALLIKDNSDIEEIRSAMSAIISDVVLRQDLIAKGKEQAGKFSWEKCAKQTLEVLLNIN